MQIIYILLTPIPVTVFKLLMYFSIVVVVVVYLDCIDL
jgi:hypothetical protein